MERILVSMSSRMTPWEALTRSVALARRINARVFVLTVVGPGKSMEDIDPENRTKLEQLVEAAGEDGVHIDSFISEGNYEDEVITFVKHNKITLLVTEYGTSGDKEHEREQASLQKIRHRVSCRVEIVTPRKSDYKRK